jgi:hypothetical protein
MNNLIFEAGIATAAAIVESGFDAKASFYKKIDHKISFITRVVVALGLAIWTVDGIIPVILHTLVIGTVFTMVFDISFNKWAGRPSYLLGKTAVTDRLARKLGADLHGWTALKGVFLAVILLIIRYI